jgi:hypothetical protein
MLDHYMRKSDPISTDGGGTCGSSSDGGGDDDNTSTQQSKLITLYSLTDFLTNRAAWTKTVQVLPL